ncbi:hypothetical protein K439DRAFT_478772 [Ramaria rubella]|nr:hypothetical protein K439DRAFT_478772 [Ramaria rubella]
MHSPNRTAVLSAYLVFFGFSLVTSSIAQVAEIPPCVMSCLSTASQASGCSGVIDWTCACKNPSFQPASNQCFVQTCTSNNALIGESLVDTECSNEASTSIPPPFSPPSTASTTSGISNSPTTSLSVTDSLTSPPEHPTTSPPGPVRTSNTLAPPIPPSSIPGPPPIPSGTSPIPSSLSTPILSPTPSAISPGSTTVMNSTLASNSSTPSVTTVQTTVSSGVIQPPPTNTGNNALGWNAQGDKKLGVVLMVFGISALL